MAGGNKEWESLGYVGKHKRIWMRYGKAKKCESKRCHAKCKTFTWSNKSGLYLEAREDWWQLCASCHKKYDLESRERFLILLNGLKRIFEETKYILGTMEG